MSVTTWLFRNPFFLFVLLILLKIMFVRSFLFGSVQLFDSLFIELPMIILICMMIEWINRGKLWLYALLNLLLSLIFFAMLVYYQYFGAIVTYTSLWNLNQVGEIRDSIALLIHPAFWLLFVDLPFLVAALFWKGKAWHTLTRTAKTFSTKWSIGLFFVSCVVVIIHALNHIGEEIVNEIKKAEGMGLISYEAYVVYADLKRDYQPQHTITLRSIQNLKGIIPEKEPGYFGIAKDRDIYVVQLEAIQNFLIGLEIDGREVMPTLNRLIEESFYFPNVFQQIGKGNTSDAEFMLNTSLYPSSEFPSSKQFGRKEIPSLPRYLKPLGYESVTLHTNDVQFWDRHLMYEALGFDRYYDAAYFGKDDFLVFGASDEVLYEKSIDVFLDMKERGKKIYANLIAMSSHSPFEIPEEKHPFRLPERLQDSLFGQYIQAAHYADFALGKLIEALQRNGLWDNAMLVIYGDHFGFASYAPEEDKELAAEILGIDEYTTVEVFNVPLIIKVPGHDEPIQVETVGGQVDLLPTISNLIGLPLDEQIYFGQDLLNTTSNLIPERVYLPTGSFINDEILFIPGKGFEDGTALPLFPHQQVAELEQYREDFKRALQLLEMSDLYANGLPPLIKSD